VLWQKEARPLEPHLATMPEEIKKDRQVNVCVVGSTAVDLVARVPRLAKTGETLVGSAFALSNGGKGGNQAVMAAKLGAAVTIVTRVGSDAFGDGALANYRANGIDVTYVARDALLPSGVAVILVNDAAQNSIVIVPGANGALSVDDVANAQTAIEAATVLVCQLEVPVATVLAAFQIARRAGVVTILNPAPAVAVPQELWRLTDVAVPNETEAETLTGIGVVDDRDAERAGRALLARGTGAAIVTLGQRGSLIVTPERIERIASPVVKAVDATGAGDAFVGTLAYCLGAGFSLFEAAQRANLVGAFSVTGRGTQISYPDLHTAERYLGEHGLTLKPACASAISTLSP
jgi:ribokinase